MPEDLLDVPLICPRQGLQKELSDWFQEKVDRLNIVATCNLAYNGGVLAREGLGCLLSFGKLTDTGPDSPLCFRPLTPTLHSKLFLAWKKYAASKQPAAPPSSASVDIPAKPRSRNGSGVFPCSKV